MAAVGVILVRWWMDSFTAAWPSLCCTPVCAAGISLVGLGIKLAPPKLLYVPDEFTLLHEDSSQFFVFFKGIINDVIRSQTSEASPRLTDAKFNTPIHYEDKNVNDGFIV